MSKITRGVPEVPLLASLDPQHRQFLQDLREQVLQLRQQQALPAPPSNFRVIPQAFSNLLQWTRGLNADFTQVFWNTVPTFATAIVVTLGSVQNWVDQVGEAGITRYYWVRSGKNTGALSNLVGPISGTTLSSTSGVTPPAPPPPAQGPVFPRS